MADLINMPKLGFDMQEGQLIGWLKKPGDTVEAGDVIAEIESDKATVEVEAYVAGTLLELLVQEGDWVPIGAPIAVVGEKGEEYDLAALGVAEQAPAEKAPAEQAPAEAEAEAAPARQAAPAAAPAAAPPAGGDGNGFPGGVRASPLARRVAEDMGIDLAQVPGSGPQGRVVKADVEAYSAEAPAPAPARAAAPGRAAGVGYMAVQPGPDDEVIETPRLRARIGQRMVEAKLQIPHFYVTADIDVGMMLKMRESINKRLESEGIKVSVNDFMVKAAALALREYPNLNSSFNGDTIVRHRRINIGIAVAIEGGLLNVVSQDADKATLSVLAVRHKTMIARAREGKVKPEDVEGETFAVSNLGPWDVDHFIAIINPPAAAILALGTAMKVPVVLEDGSLGVGNRMKATISADHRVTDGAEAAAFLKLFKDILEDPIRLLV